MFLELAELGALALFLDLLAELLELALLGLVLLLGLPDRLQVSEAARVPSLLVQKLQRHRLLPLSDGGGGGGGGRRFGEGEKTETKREDDK